MGKAELPAQAQSPPPSAELLLIVCSTSYSAALLHATTLAVLHSDSSGLMAYPLVMTTVLYWETVASGRKSHPCLAIQLLLLESPPTLRATA